MNEPQPAPRPASALIAEATKRAGLIWVEVPGQDRARPAWHIWLPAGGGARAHAPGAAYVLTGPGEQTLPGLAEAAQVTVIVASKESGGRLVSWTAEVSRVEPGGAEWDAVIGPLLAGRLNAALGPGEASPAERWARTGAVFRLSPTRR